MALFPTTTSTKVPNPDELRTALKIKFTIERQIEAP